ncbi:hypothetical protein [Novosphingobium sp.]|jgi:hypothetical protein|uniref:hypothetical protein n=2 Tax=Pseudomonadota TaxID=1224 RepID=UPI000B16CD7D|nr:hypothetical protein [Novosphingobium sp.]MBX9664453.1 hypothetical protein [Novosphingobium sp.]
MSRLPARRPMAILAAPLGIASLVVAGLIAGLTGSGWRDAFCTGALAVPLFVFLFHFLRRSRPSAGSDCRPNQKARP